MNTSKTTYIASIVGMRYRPVVFNLEQTLNRHPVILKREPNNPHDSNAIKVITKNAHFGYINKDISSQISSILSEDPKYKIDILCHNKNSIRVKIVIERESLSPPKPLTSIQCGIYQITCKTDGATYIGQSVNINKRIAQHWKELFSRRHKNSYLQIRWDDEGASSFAVKVIETLDTTSMTDLARQRKLAELEAHWISVRRSDSLCLNIFDGEIISAGNAQKEFEIETRKKTTEHNKWVKAEKLNIKNRIEELNNKRIFLRKELSKIGARLNVLSKSISRDTGVTGFFLGKKLSGKEIERQKNEHDNLINKQDAYSCRASEIFNETYRLKKKSRTLRRRKHVKILLTES